ncbi:hypothetical protein OUZ56_005535 [Daphnia magna]|uniref:Uncharacterized protein n=1 Tax=Daphnia magna TaxID=35525 RepID=A0ABQ9YTS5_9CRUS|nr:hypothetical protein OUZ56_005535 [Daphnia magna]
MLGLSRSASTWMGFTVGVPKQKLLFVNRKSEDEQKLFCTIFCRRAITGWYSTTTPGLVVHIADAAVRSCPGKHELNLRLTRQHKR